VTREDILVPTIGDSTGPEAPFSELVRLQMDFQARLAEEILRYVRRIQASALPITPSTVVRSDPGRAPQLAIAGNTVTIIERLENRQRVHAIITAALTPLVSDDGTTWFAQTEPTTAIVPPGEDGQVEFRFGVPSDMPAGTYRGALVLTGLEGAAVPIAIAVSRPAARRKNGKNGNDKGTK
jgi:hypothetical protein